MPQFFTLQHIADAIDGRLIGDGAFKITRLAHPADIQDAGDLALAMDSKLLPLLRDSPARAAVIALPDEKAEGLPASYIIAGRPRLALAQLTALFAEPVPLAAGIHASAVIEPGAQIGSNACIGAFVYIGKDATIGDNTRIHPHVYIGPAAVIGDQALVHAGVRIGSGTRIGQRAIIHFNASIGADGFSFVTPQAGSVETAKKGGSGEVTAQNTQLIRIASLAPVIIGDDVEIGANTSIDRGTIVSTRIGSGTKIDNQVQIGHNVQIGDNCMICGRVGIAGSVEIGDRVVLGGGVGVADHLKIGDDAMAMAGSGLGGNVPPRTIVGGYPAQPRAKAMENLFNIGRLTNFYSKIKDLTARLELLEKKSEKD